jgi:O-antigen ligase
MGYFLFLLVTATLFVRPAEIFSAVHAWPIYECLILACLAVSLSGVLNQLSLKSLYENPITACVIGLWAAVVLSHLAHFDLWSARMSGFMFFKIVVYYLLLVANINSEKRLKSFLRWLLFLIAVLAVLALLANYHVIELSGVDFLAERQHRRDTEEVVVIPRLQSTGIFNNPNNLGMILVPGVVIALYFAADPAAGMLRPLGLALAGLFGYAIYGTQSRGGLLALMGALLTLCWARWGWRRAALIVAVALPVLLVAFKGRMTDYDRAMTEDTGQARVQIWSQGFALFKQQPLFGIGQGQYVEEVGYVAHNTFVQCFTELGLLGGGMFASAFMAAFVMLYRIRDQIAPLDLPGLSRMLPSITAIVVGFVTSMLASTRDEFIPTYLVLGLATVCAQSAAEQTGFPPVLRFDSRFIKMIVFGSLATVVILYVFIQVTVRWSS